MGLGELVPIFKRHNTIKKPVIYFTKNKTLALFYIWNRAYKYVTFNVNEKGVVEYIEEFPNQLYDFYNGISGCIYVCDEDSNIQESHIKGVYISLVPIKVKEKIHINNAYEQILEEEKLGHIIIKRYNELTKEEIDKMKKGRVRAIHMQHLLNPQEEYEEYMAKFMAEKFPEEWSIALNNSEEEIREMINQWRISIGLQSF